MYTVKLRGQHLVWAITGKGTILKDWIPFNLVRLTFDFCHLACCCQGFLLLGYDQGVMSGIVSDFYSGFLFNDGCTHLVCPRLAHKISSERILTTRMLQLKGQL
jgi:hypothetical protein